MLLPSSSRTLRVAQIISDTDAEGPGRRFALWLQGCPRACPGCCNPEMRAPSGGRQVTLGELVRELRAARGIEGLTLLGGEPFLQAAPLATLCREAKSLGLSVMVFTGYTLEQLGTLGADAVSLLAEVDLLVDGPYRAELPERRRRWVGSANQGLRFLSSRYAPDDPRFGAPNTLEIRLQDGELRINGWPPAASRVIS